MEAMTTATVTANNDGSEAEGLYLMTNESYCTYNNEFTVKPGNNQTVDKRAGQTETLFRDSGSVFGGYLGIMYFRNLESSLLEGPIFYLPIDEDSRRC